jgi:hypothetical protein
MKRSLLILFCSSLLFLGTANRSFATSITNGDFSLGLTGWTYLDASSSGGVATLSDVNGYAFIYQSVLAAAGPAVLQFDFFAPISPVSGGGFSDLFAVSLYFGPNATAIDPLVGSTFVGAPNIPILDTNAGFLTLSQGTLGESSRGNGWSHITVNFDNPGADWMFPLFELFDLNGQPDSAVFIADVSLEPAAAATVPEPSSLLLLAIGLTGLFYLRRKKTI